MVAASLIYPMWRVRFYCTGKPRSAICARLRTTTGESVLEHQTARMCQLLDFMSTSHSLEAYVVEYHRHALRCGDAHADDGPNSRSQVVVPRALQPDPYGAHHVGLRNFIPGRHVDQKHAILAPSHHDTQFLRTTSSPANLVYTTPPPRYTPTYHTPHQLFGKFLKRAIKPKPVFPHPDTWERGLFLL